MASDEVDDDEKAFWGEIAAFRQSQDEASLLLQATSEAIRTSEYCAQSSQLHDESAEHGHTNAWSEHSLSAPTAHSYDAYSVGRGYTDSEQDSLRLNDNDDALSIASAPADISADGYSPTNRVNDLQSHHARFNNSFLQHSVNGDNESIFNGCESCGQSNVLHGRANVRSTAGCDECETCHGAAAVHCHSTDNFVHDSDLQASQQHRVAASDTIMNDEKSSWKQSLRLDALESSSTALRQQALLLKYSSEELRAENTSLKRKLLQQYNVEVGDEASIHSSNNTSGNDDTMFGDTTTNSSMRESHEQLSIFASKVSPEGTRASIGQSRRDNSVLYQEDLSTSPTAQREKTSHNSHSISDSPLAMSHSAHHDASALSAKEDMDQIVEHCKRLLGDVEYHRFSLSKSQLEGSDAGVQHSEVSHAGDGVALHAASTDGQHPVRLTEDVVRHELALLRDQLKHSQAETEQLAKDNYTLAMLAKQNQADDADRFKIQCDGHAAVVRAVRAENETLASENQRLQQEIIALVAEKKDLVGENQYVSHRCDQLAAESVRMKEAAQELREFTNTLRDTLKKYYVANKTLNKKVHRLEAERTAMDETLARLRSDLSNVHLEETSLDPPTVANTDLQTAEHITTVEGTTPPTAVDSEANCRDLPRTSQAESETDDTAMVDTQVELDAFKDPVDPRDTPDRGTSQTSLLRVAQALTSLRENIEKLSVTTTTPRESPTRACPNDDTSSESMGESWREDFSLSSATSSHISTRSRVSHRSDDVSAKVTTWDADHTAACAKDSRKRSSRRGVGACDDIITEAHALRSTTHALRKENRALRKKLHRRHPDEAHKSRPRTHAGADATHHSKHRQTPRVIDDISNTWDVDNRR